MTYIYVVDPPSDCSRMLDGMSRTVVHDEKQLPALRHEVTTNSA